MSLPTLYHLHHSRHPEDLTFWLDLASQQGSPILELGCGTGRVLMELARAGHQVYGLDNNPGMLAYLSSQLAPGGPQPAGLIQADMAAFHLEQLFALILLPCNTWSTLTSQLRAAALAGVRRHLKLGGLFAASLPNPAALLSLPSESEAEVEDTFYHPVSGDPVQVSSAWQRTSHHFRLTWYYDILHSNGQVDRTAVETVHSLDPASIYMEELAAAGLQVAGVFGDYDRSAFTRRSPYLILLASY